MSAAARCAAIVILWAIAAPARGDQTTPLPDSKTRPDSIVFAAIPWRTPVDEAATRLQAHGFKETRAARTKDRLAAEGRLFDQYVMVHGGLDDHGGVIRWDITIPSKGERDEWAVQRKIYDDAVAEMIRKYGRRRQATEKYRFPYAKGDGNQARGVRQGYVSLASEWGSKSGDRLQIALANDMSVILAYESREWRKVMDERRRKKAKDL
jgi:hypothetical protein